VVVHLSFGERSAGPEIREQSPEGQDPLAEGVSATLESIRRQIEEGSGKLEVPPPPEGTEPQLDENPAVVDQDPPPDPTRDWRRPQYSPRTRGSRRYPKQESKHGRASMDLGGLSDLNLSELQQYLGSMNFPADKQEVASHAESNDAPQAVVAQIRNSAIERFDSPEEVLQAVRGR
jgi:hypothetical protein